MGENSKIEWTDHTFNPWIGCTKIDELCSNCYAEKYSERWGHAKWGPRGDRKKTADSNWNKPYAWNRQAKKEGVRKRVFCASLSDVFDDHESIKQEWRDQLWKIIKETEHLDWLLLTKRPENYVKFLPADWGQGYPNVWLGCSIGDQIGRDARMDAFINTPAYIHFISAEPLLHVYELPQYGIDFLIIGGESGTLAKIRTLNLSVVKHMLMQAKNKGIKVFFKQLGSALSKQYKLNDGHGGTFEEYPELLDWLKIREIPESHPSFKTIPSVEEVDDLTLEF